MEMPVRTAWRSRVRTTPRPCAPPFFIDPKSVLRAMVGCPMSSGRSIDEFMRLLQAMQPSDNNGVPTPVGWTPGADVIVPPPKTAGAADK